MNALEKISKETLRELLTKGWITHDAMWVLHCMNELGMKKTNEINRAAVRSMAAIEIGRIKEVLGINKDSIDSFEELVTLFQDTMDILKADFMKIRLSIPSKNVFQWEIENGECFAYKGMSRIGGIDEYECGVIYRIETWLDTLNIKYTIDPPVRRCIMHTDGKCAGKIVVELEGD